ncbi:MAG: phosphotransferase [Bacteroidota bacterium]
MPVSLPLPTDFSSFTFTDFIQEPANLEYLSREALLTFLPQQRWFMSKGKVVAGCTVEHVFVINAYTAILLCRTTFVDGSSDLYQLPVAWNTEPEWLDFFGQFNSHQIIASFGEPVVAILSDAIPRANFRKQLFTEMKARTERVDTLSYDAGKGLRDFSGEVTSILPNIDTSNTAIIYGDAYFFKLFRKLDPGLNPDLELIRYLSEETPFDNSPAYGGSMTVGKVDDPTSINLGLMIEKVDNHGDAWELFQELTEGYYNRVMAHLNKLGSVVENKGENGSPGRTEHRMIPSFQPVASHADLPTPVASLIDANTYHRAALLGQRTAEMHLALAGAPAERTALATEPLTQEYRQEIFQAGKKMLDRQFTELSDKIAGLAEDQQAEAKAVLEARDQIEARLAAIKDQVITADICRVHGDYHLGQVLYTDTDYYIIDFEGEPLLSIPERRRKRPPFKDVAGMIRSFHYAAQGQLLLNSKYTKEEREALAPWGDLWFRHMRHAFLSAYLETAGDAPFVPIMASEREDLLDFFVMEKAIYEVAYELNSRPDWLAIPLRGLLFALIDNLGR